jgi:hypothetical protein
MVIKLAQTNSVRCPCHPLNIPFQILRRMDHKGGCVTVKIIQAVYAGLDMAGFVGLVGLECVPLLDHVVPTVRFRGATVPGLAFLCSMWSQEIHTNFLCDYTKLLLSRSEFASAPA